MYGDRCVGQHGLGPCGRDLNAPLPVFEGIADGVKLSFSFFVLNFDVGDRGGAARAPVDHALAPIDQSGAIKIDKHTRDGAGEPLIHGETMAIPVTRQAKTLLLCDDALVVLILPAPCPL